MGYIHRTLRGALKTEHIRLLPTQAVIADTGRSEQQRKSARDALKRSAAEAASIAAAMEEEAKQKQALEEKIKAMESKVGRGMHSYHVPLFRASNTVQRSSAADVLINPRSLDKGFRPMFLTRRELQTLEDITSVAQSLTLSV